MVKLAIIGKMGSGKTTLVKHLVAEYNFIEFNFGDPVKKYANEIFGIETIKEKPRKFIQEFAEILKTLDQNVWVNYIKRQIGESKDIVVGDVRFMNEYQMLREQGFKFILLDISEEYQVERLKKTYPNNYLEHLERRGHISEQNVYKFPADYYYHINETTENDLNEYVRQIIEREQ
jgi:dephospho-CoA kinase